MIGYLEKRKKSINVLLAGVLDWQTLKHFIIFFLFSLKTIKNAP